MPADREWPNASAVEAAIAKFRARRSLRGATDLGAHEDMREILRAAAEASPVVPVPPCPTCKGSGKRPCNCRPGWDGNGVYHGLNCPVYVGEPCPSCNGSGRDRLIPESEIRALVRSFHDIRDVAVICDRLDEQRKG